MISLLLALLQLISIEVTSFVETKDVKVEESVVTWKGAKVTGSHTGKVNIKSGKMEFAEGVFTGGSFVIDMPTMVSDDMGGGGSNRLMVHMKSADFFDVEKYPTSTLKITKAISRGKPGEYKIIGDITIKGITKSIKFDAMVNANSATAEIALDRADFDIKYGSGSFFDNLGDKTIYDEFTLGVSLKY